MRIRDAGAVITGASEGLGAALAQALAREGAHVVLVARREKPLAEVARRIRDSGGVAHAVAADVGDKGAIHRLAATAAELLGHVDLLVHNASTLGPTPLRALMDTDCEDLERVLAVNLVGPFRLTKAMMGAALLRGAGLVLQITSDASAQAYAKWGAYGVSKAALDHLGRIWAEENRELGARLITVDPGEMNTRMHAEAMPEADVALLATPAAVAERLVQLIASADTVPTGSRVELNAWRAAG